MPLSSSFKKPAVKKAPPSCHALKIVLFNREFGAILESKLAVGPLGFEPRTDELKVRCSATLYGTFLVLFAVSTWFPLSLAALFLLGLSSSIYMISVQTTLQVMVPEVLRGRVMGTYGMTWSLGPLGTLQAGAIASLLGRAGRSFNLRRRGSGIRAVRCLFQHESAPSGGPAGLRQKGCTAGRECKGHEN